MYPVIFLRQFILLSRIDFFFCMNHSYMYWTDWGSTAKIERSSMSGDSRSAIVTSNLQWPNGIAIDSSQKKLYWTDAGYDKIERSNLDGLAREVITCSFNHNPHVLPCLAFISVLHPLYSSFLS